MTGRTARAENFGQAAEVDRPPIATEPFDLEKEEFRLKRDFALHIMRVFLWANAFVLVIIAISMIADWIMVAHGLVLATERLVSEEVLMALLGATTVQVGAIAVTISTHLFPKGS